MGSNLSLHNEPFPDKKNKHTVPSVHTPLKILRPTYHHLLGPRLFALRPPVQPGLPVPAAVRVDRLLDHVPLPLLQLALLLALHVERRHLMGSRLLLMLAPPEVLLEAEVLAGADVVLLSVGYCALGGGPSPHAAQAALGDAPGAPEHAHAPAQAVAEAGLSGWRRDRSTRWHGLARAGRREAGVVVVVVAAEVVRLVGLEGLVVAVVRGVCERELVGLTLS